MKMTVREASDWVLTQTIAEETLAHELVAAFTALTGRRPLPADRPDDLFRQCTEVVMSASVGTPASGAGGPRP